MPATRWTLQQSKCFLFRQWGNESVVYDTRNGDTHWLDPVTRVVLDILAESPRDPAELTRNMSDRVDMPPDIDRLAFTESILQQLRRIGLAKPDSA